TGAALFALLVVVAGTAWLAIGPQSELDRHVDGSLHTHELNQPRERGVGRGGQCVGHIHRPAIVAGVDHAPGLLGAALGATVAHTLGLEPAGNLELGVDAHSHL